MNLRPALLVLSLFIAADASASRLTNLSVRSNAGTGADTLIVGFTIGGTGTKSVLVRGVGPTLGTFGVSGVVADPQVLLFSGTTQINQNDNWGGSTALASTFASVGAFALPASSADAALTSNLPVGSYTAQLAAKSGPGVALLECYDVDALTASARFTNVSARSQSGAGANVLTVGFAVTGTDPTVVLIRGIGPTLGGFGVTGTLPTARLQLFDWSSTQIGDNDAWTTTATPPATFTGVGAFALPTGSKDGVLMVGLPPGTYTAQVSGANNETGNALIEVYEVTNPPASVVTLQPVTNAALGAPSDPGAGTASAGPDAQPAVITRAAPSYPFEFRVAGITGAALVDFYVKSDGSVGNAIAIHATDVRLGTASANAVAQWKFTPGRSNGRLVTTHMQVPIIFQLN